MLPAPRARHRSGPLQRRWQWAVGLFCALVALMTVDVPRAAVTGPWTLAQAERVEPDGRVITIRLPDEVTGATGEIVERPYRLSLDLGPDRRGLAMYLPGMLGHGRISVNGHVLFDSLGTAGPRPRGLNLLRLFELPPAFLVDGVNRFEITLRAPTFVSLSRVIVGPDFQLRELRDRKAVAGVFGPMLVATVIACLGLSVLLVFLRGRNEPVYGYFAVGSITWGVHTVWTVLPVPPLPGVHNIVWWTALYSFFVIMLLNFALRFSGHVWPRVESALLRACIAAPLLFYAAQALDALDPVTNLWRLGLVIAAFGTLAVVAHSAWRQRSLDNALLVLASLAAAALGLRDWIVFQQDDDNWPVALAPYAGLPLVMLVAWFLIDRFVRTTESLEGLNRELETRVESKSAELVTALDHMRAARDGAESANQAKSSFLAAASHDLRQPIHALGLYLGALRQRPLDPTAADIVQRMDGSIAALDTMFDALLDISRMDAGVVLPQPCAFDLEAMLRRLVEEFATQAAQRGLRLGVRVADGARARIARSDPLLLERVLRNLIGNAVKYTQKGGVLVSCRRRGRQTWRIEVWDTGPGIPEVESERVFDEFYQVGNPERDRRSGLGLGLSIVRRITRLLKLPLALYSRPGHGTRFVLDVPASDEAVLPLHEVDASGSLDGIAVAMIEDDPEVRDSMRALLESWGCRVTEGADADEVLARLPVDARPPQALIADLRLLGSREGIGEVTRLRRHLARTVPALIVSGDSAPERVRLMQDSGLPWLSKPVPAARLRSWLLSVTRSAADAAPATLPERAV